MCIHRPTYILVLENMKEEKRLPPCATLALKRHIPVPLLHPSQRRLHPMGFLFVWYFVYRLCGQIRTITVKIFPVSYGLASYGYKRWRGRGILRLPPRAVLVRDANAHFKEGNKDKFRGERKRSRFREPKLLALISLSTPEMSHCSNSQSWFHVPRKRDWVVTGHSAVSIEDSI